jgi:Putative S-adenosyl-L-methionine-dependent methyltransferase
VDKRKEVDSRLILKKDAQTLKD